MFTLDTTTTANAERAQEQSSFTSLSSIAGAGAAEQHLLVSPPGQISFHPRSPRCSPLTLSPGVVGGPAACNASPRIAAIAARGRLSLVAVVVQCSASFFFLLLPCSSRPLSVTVTVRRRLNCRFPSKNPVRTSPTVADSHTGSGSDFHPRHVEFASFAIQSSACLIPVRLYTPQSEHQKVNILCQFLIE